MKNTSRRELGWTRAKYATMYATNIWPICVRKNDLHIGLHNEKTPKMGKSSAVRLKSRRRRVIVARLRT